MAGDWIKIRTSLVRDGRVRIVSRKCHAPNASVVGALVTLWCLADEHSDENGSLFGWTKEDIDQFVELPGFCDSLPSDWIDLSGEFVNLPNYQEHNGQTAKSRAQASKRQKLSRSQRDKSVTREEKRREENITPIIPLPESVLTWVDYRKQIKKPLKQPTIDGLVKRHGEWGESRFAAAVKNSIEQGYQGLFEPNSNSKRKSTAEIQNDYRQSEKQKALEALRNEQST